MPRNPKAIDKELLDVLVCPETREKLTPAGDDVLEKVNQAIAAGKLRNRGGRTLATRLDAGLVRPDGKVLFPVQEQIPNLLLDEAIPLDDL